MPTLFVTGANRGLGLEFVRQYAADGWDIIACCRSPEKADKLQALAKNNKVRIEALDVGDTNAIRKCAAALKDTAIDVLINNAGVLSGSKASMVAEGDKGQDFGGIDAEAWDKVMRVNTIAPIMVIEAFTPHLKKGTQRKAVNITSRMGSIDAMGSGFIAYRTSKAALNAAMRVIAHDLKSAGIAIVNLHPGWVKTDMGGAEAAVEIPVSIAGMRKVISGLSLKESGQFLSFDGTLIPW